MAIERLMDELLIYESLTQEYSSLHWLKSKYQQQGEADMIQMAFDFAYNAHKTQARVSGEPYITHSLEVACILADMGMDATAIQAGLLHDVVEDTDITVEQISERFNPAIAAIVDGVTKLSKLETRTRVERQAESFRKMFLAMAKDIRVILIKLADRLHNMRTLSVLPPAKRYEIAMETMEIYAPLAHRLGIFSIKNKLEDLALLYIDPEKYQYISERIDGLREKRESYMLEIIATIRKRLSEAGIQAEITGRNKHFHSIYRKMITQGKDIDEIYDLTAVRIIVNTVLECYAALGVIHDIWKPIPGRFKDFVAMPKENMYQSIHTTLMGEKGEPFEIQIRTAEMHKIAEYGIAAHWRYKEGVEKNYEQYFDWLRQSLEWQSEVQDNDEYLEMLKLDMFEDIVFAFTPKGDVIEMPYSSTALDFAYRVHTGIGHSCIGCKVNNRIVPLDYELRSGDIVEILTSKNSSGPKMDWLNIVRTSNAKGKIRNWLNKERRGEYMDKGKEILDQLLQKMGKEAQARLSDEDVLKVAKKLSCPTMDDLLVSLGDGSISTAALTNRLKEEYFKNILPALSDAEIEAKANEEGALAAKKQEETTGRAPGGVVIEGIDNVLTRLSHCCNPLPGDNIIGYVTRGKGVSIHRSDCSNANHYLKNEKDRIMDVYWGPSLIGSFIAELEIESRDRRLLISDILAAVHDIRVPMHSISSRGGRSGYALTKLKVEIKNTEHLQYVIEQIQKVKNVVSVRRVTPGRDMLSAGSAPGAGLKVIS